ncbi:glycerophosphodiester phosphodiesterase [Ascidiimonas aurantiaca]|uniref:glycerophosphodiester phosphodiesterase n=1 Tax=Ascidiimonas aurantiaca TaxID=1685432 RepID=UPI0030EE0278
MKHVFFSLVTGLITLLLFNCTNVKKEMMVIGHRGAMGYETENTLASVQRALELGVDAIEIDVFKIKSGEIVVFHDEKVNKLTDGTGKIEDLNVVQVKNLTLKGGHRIPLLQDVLKLINGKCKLNIELKGADTAEKVDHIINYYVKEKDWKMEDFIISSFRWDELEHYRTFNEKIAIAVLTEADPLAAIETAKKLDAVAINPYYKLLTAEVVSQIHENGLKVYPWTVNQKKDIESMRAIGVDGIFTNYPDRVKK